MINIKHLIWVLLFFVTTVNAQSELDIATKAIKDSKDKYHLTDADLANWLVTDQYVSKQSGLTNIYLRQTHQGIEVTDANINIHIDAAGKVAHKRSTFVPNLASRIKTNKAVISAAEAVEIAAAKYDLQPKGLKTTNEHPGNEIIFNEAGIAMDPISAKLAYHVVTNKDIRLAWTIKIYTEDAQHQWITTVDAATGDILKEADGVIHCTFGGGAAHVHCIDEVEALEAHYNMLAGKTAKTGSVPNSYYVLPLGIESPNHGALATMVNPADALASPDGWHDDGNNTYTITRGNNVYAQDDANGNNGFGYAPDGGANLEFIFNYDATSEPTPNRDVAITNLFYWNNLVHDLWYHHGFDEASGNFQENNFGRGGIDGDYVIADAQDGSGQNNANMSSGTDGANGRMQMFLWDAGGGISAFEATDPPAIAGTYGSASAQFGATGYNVSGMLVEAEPLEGCTAYTNAAAINGNIAIVDRGTCQFGIKCLNAETAGAIAVVVCNNAPGNPINMAEGDDGAFVNIPAVMLSQADCATLRTQTNVMVTLAATTLPTELDGSLDAGIVAHEYGHGISTRITGGPSQSCLTNSEQMGEGWSDFFGLVMTVLPNHTAETPRGIGTYAGAQGISGGGIRTYQYSRDMTVNPHTYDDIKSEAVPHGVGSVWCAMIWDMHWDLVDFYGFDTDLYTGTGGNNIAMKLVVEGLRLQGCFPGFIDGRDAILAADEALYGGANKCIIWNAFARRGLGASAVQGSSNANGTEAFDLPDGLEGVSLVKTASLSEVEEGQTVTFTLQADNLCSVASNVIIVDDLPAGLEYVQNSASNGGTEASNTVTYPTLPSLATGSSLTYTLDATVVNGAYFPPTDLLVDDMESGAANWSTAGGNGAANWALGTGTAGSCASTSWFAEDIETDSRQYLTLAVPATPSGVLTISFDHFYDTEVEWDGGIVEISIDNGVTWINLEDKFVQNGYNQLLDPNSVLGNVNAFSGNSGGCITSIISACSYAKEDVLVRFHAFTDAFVGGNGWYIDEVRITDEAAVINEATITSGDGANTVITRDDVCIKILEGPPLPIELLSFEATANRRDIDLTWKTANEINNEGFEIYRRSEFEADFTKIGFVAGAGNSTETLGYDFTDGNVRPNVSYYYQLKQIDFDGTFSLSDIEQARINDSGQAVVTLYPNPVKDGNLYLDIMTDEDQDVTISIYNIQGKLMLQEIHAANTLTGTMKMNVNAFSAGVYVLQVSTANNVAYSDKFIKE